MTKVINFMAGPSAGKSTKALGLTSYLKTQRMNVEYHSEYAKDLVWEKRHSTIDDQIYIFGKQAHGLYTLKNQVDYIITDSPLFLSMFYVHRCCSKFKEDPKFIDWQQSFENLVMRTINMYENVNFFVDRGTREYIKEGRVTKYEDALKIDNSIKNLLTDYEIPFTIVSHDESNESIFQKISS